MGIASFRMPTNIRFGEGSCVLIGEILAKAGCKKPLVVTDRELLKLDVFTNFSSLLKENRIPFEIYSEAVGNPIKSHVTQGVEAYRKAQCDSLILFGGGCALDVGKAIALMIHHPGDLFDYEDDLPGARPIDKAIPYVVAIPTTAGTGSEVGASSVISDDKSKAKKIIFSPRLTPAMVLADPLTTTSLPRKITAATGIDALTHNLEAYLAKSYHPICESIAVGGLALVRDHLQTVCERPNDIAARGHMLMASMMGAIAFQKGLGVNHSCAHALSTVYDMHHGLANAVMLRSCMEFNFEKCESRFDNLAFGLFGDKRGKLVLEWLNSLVKSLEIPKLSGMGLDFRKELIDVAVADVCHGNNPRPCAREDFEKIFANAFGH
jgi:alcohol dehydrogenase class IV